MKPTRLDYLRYDRSALAFHTVAADLQRDRCLVSIPREPADAARADLDFYVVSVQRIREIGRWRADSEVA